MPRLKWRGSDSSGWSPLPAGTYNFVIDDFEETTSSNNNPQLKLSGHVMDGPHKDKKITDWFVLTDNAGWKLKQLCEAAGVDFVEEETDQVTDKGKPIFDLDVELDDLVGCAYIADCRVDEYNGRENNKFENYRSMDGAQKEAAQGGGQQQPQQSQQQGGQRQQRRRRVAP